MRKTLDSIAAHNEVAALLVMRVIDDVGDGILSQQLLSAIHRLNQDADELRKIRCEVEATHIRAS